VARHTLHRRTDPLTLVMAVITALLLGAGVWAVTHPDLGGNPGHVCRPIPGTSRLDCG